MKLGTKKNRNRVQKYTENIKMNDRISWHWQCVQECS